MILFITDYDDATHLNFCVGQDLIPLSVISLAGINANRINLLRYINDNPTFPIFAMSHGERDCLKAHEGAIGIEVTDAVLLGDRIVFAWACNTAIELGRAVQNAGGIWWGYTGLIQAPTEEEPFREMFSEIFQFIHDRFKDATSILQINRILDEIKNYCELMMERVDNLFANDQNLNVTETYLCLTQLWGNLRVWYPENELPIFHPDSPVTILHV